MTIHHFQPREYFTAIGTRDPVLRVAAGDAIVTTTVDAGGHDAHNDQVTEGGNPQTGPFFVPGAEPGDTLVVHLDRITPNRATGYTRGALAPGVVDPPYVRQLPDNPFVDWRLDPERGVATLLQPSAALAGLSVPLAPMLGCFGVAPPRRQSISTATSDAHGGNMDYRGFVAGVTVYFPVFVPGALFYLGDCHAVQGDGEIVGTGIEVSAEVQVTLDVQKGRAIGWPRGENGEYIFTVGNARPLDQALQHATTEMARWLSAEYALSPADAGILLGQCVAYDVGNVYDPAYTMVCKIAKRYLPPLPAFEIDSP